MADDGAVVEQSRVNQDVWVLVYTNEYGKVQDVEAFTTRELAMASYAHDTQGANFDDDQRTSLMPATVQSEVIDKEGNRERKEIENVIAVQFDTRAVR